MTSSLPPRTCPLCAGQSSRRLFGYSGHIGGEERTYTILKCSQCRLIFVHPVPGGAELRQFYDAEDYFAQYRDNARWKAWNVRHHSCRKLELIERHVPGRLLLDVGTADGLFPHVAATRGWHACGLDISHDSVMQARETHPDVTMIEGRLDHPALEGMHFDAITFVHNLEHYADPGAPLCSARRLLRDGGVVLVAAPNLDPQAEGFVRLLPVGRATRTRLVRMIGSIYPPNRLVVFSTATLRAFLERAGFVPLHVWYTSKVRPRFMVGWREWLAQEALRLPLWALRSGMHVEVLARKA